MASAADMMQVQSDLATLKGIVDQLGAQMQVTKIDLGNVTQANRIEMNKFEEQTVVEVRTMKDEVRTMKDAIQSTIVNATNEFEAQRQNQALLKMQTDQQKIDIETLLERTTRGNPQKSSRYSRSS